ncbi:MAG: L,D-transpeptidase/peptidoglycan binding protein [Coriobacteriales bacterium]|jgi:lipoprotein-anchoring transpeptidase ErfK/SrfK|nr:L,D-transpeptidase/peptidoglycan binding protein [Coriobacteriales bacterium]
MKHILDNGDVAIAATGKSNEVDSSGMAIWKVILLVASAVILCAAAVYACGVFYFTTHFGFNTTIDGRNVTFLTVDQAEDRIALNANNFEMNVIGREGLSLNVTAQDVGLRYSPDGQVRAIFRTQDPLLWPTRLLHQPNSATTPSFKFDTMKLSDFLQSSGIFLPENMRPPANAYPTFENGAWVVFDADPGTTLSEQETFRAVADSLVTGQLVCDLDSFDCYVEPSISNDDPGLIAQIGEFNQYAPFEITYVFGDVTETLDAFVAIDWFTTKADGTKSLNMDLLDAWLKDFCKRYDTLGTDRTFTTTRGDVITLGAGNYGWQIDRAAERKAIISAIANQSSETREPYYLQQAAVRTTELGVPDWGNTYIEIDQTNQKLYYYVDGQLSMSCDVITGLPTPRWTTPCGVFNIIYKSSPARLRGPIQEDGNPLWDANVTYWMLVTPSGAGMHDASWQPWFGGNRYMWGGSHGCINMPYYRAQELYRSADVGTPVLIYW